MATWTHARLVRVLERHGRFQDAADALAADQPVLASPGAVVEIAESARAIVETDFRTRGVR